MTWKRVNAWALRAGVFEIEKIERLVDGQFSGNFSYVVWRLEGNTRLPCRGPFDTAEQAKAVVRDVLS